MKERENPLLRVPPDRYGPHYHDHLLEQYKLYVEMANHISERRESANSYLLTINSFLITLYGLALSALSSAPNHLWEYLIPAAGLLICVTWLLVIRSYRELNSVKFKVVHEIEQHLPVAAFEHEWELAGRGRGRYTPLTHIEPYVPWIFAALYILLGTRRLWST